jgi:hypothetical protein
VETGQYSFEASLPGFTTYKRQSSYNPERRGDVILQLAGVAVRVEVSTARSQTAAKEPLSPTVPTPARIGGDVAAPNLIYSPKPAYPLQPIRNRFKATCSFRA